MNWTESEKEKLAKLHIELFVPNEECYCCLLEFEEPAVLVPLEELSCLHTVHTDYVKNQNEILCYCGVMVVDGAQSTLVATIAIVTATATAIVTVKTITNKVAQKKLKNV